MSVRITISGYYGFHNTGDEALLAAMISDLRSEMGDPRVVVLSRDPEETARSHGVESINRFDPVGIGRIIRNTDLFISGGGTLLQDKTSLRSLLYYALLSVAANKAGSRLMLYANGLGPLESRTGRSLARTVIRAADAITLRDALSRAKMASLFGGAIPSWLEGRVRVTADPALGLKPADADRVSALMRTENLDRGFGPMIVVSLRSWPGDRELAASLAAALGEVHRRWGLCPVFLPLQHPADMGISLATRDMLDDSVPSRVVTTQYTPREVTGLIGRARAVVGMRLHALILAVAAGVPAAGLVYDPKVTGFLNDLGLPAAGDIASLDRADLAPAMGAFIEQLDDHAARIRSRRPGLANLAAENARIAARLLS